MCKQAFCFYFLLIFSSLIFFHSWGGELSPSMHVITVSSCETEKMRPLLDSAKKHKISLHVLGLHQPYLGNGQKLLLIREFVRTLPEKEIVLFVDAYDVLFLANQETIVERFLSLETPLLVSAEKVCFPLRYLARLYPPTQSPFKYLNSGAFIGYAGFIREVLEKIPINPAFSDQAQLTEYFIGHRFPFTLDYFATLFLNLYGVSEEEVVISPESHTLYSKTTQSFPLIIHANGKSFGAVYQSAYELLCLD